MKFCTKGNHLGEKYPPEIRRGWALKNSEEIYSFFLEGWISDQILGLEEAFLAEKYQTAMDRKFKHSGLHT